MAEVCLLKNHATQIMGFCADAAVEMLRGMGEMRSMASPWVDRQVT